jgi:hypothetical protein
MPTYEDHLQEAAMYESIGDIDAALRSIARARRQTPDRDERAQLEVWEERLRNEKEATDAS